jgi:hypothetical protein
MRIFHLIVSATVGVQLVGYTTHAAVESMSKKYQSAWPVRAGSAGLIPSNSPSEKAADVRAAALTRPFIYTAHCPGGRANMITERPSLHTTETSTLIGKSPIHRTRSSMDNTKANPLVLSWPISDNWVQLALRARVPACLSERKARQRQVAFAANMRRAVIGRGGSLYILPRQRAYSPAGAVEPLRDVGIGTYLTLAAASSSQARCCPPVGFGSGQGYRD